MAQHNAETVEQLRQLERDRLDTMLDAIWPRVRAGELRVIDRALRIMERRSKLEGLDGPERHLVGGLVHLDVDVEEVKRAERAFLARTGHPVPASDESPLGLPYPDDGA
jgi:hypothetical protein